MISCSIAMATRRVLDPWRCRFWRSWRLGIRGVSGVVRCFTCCFTCFTWCLHGRCKRNLRHCDIATAFRWMGPWDFNIPCDNRSPLTNAHDRWPKCLFLVLKNRPCVPLLVWSLNGHMVVPQPYTNPPYPPRSGFTGYGYGGDVTFGVSGGGVCSKSISRSTRWCRCLATL